MSSPRQPIDERLEKLDRELRAIEAAREHPKLIVRAQKSEPKLIGAGERRFRRILLGLISVWSAIVFGLMVLQNSWTLTEWIFAPIFAVAITMLSYAIALFQIELGKSIWRGLRKRQD